jgi:hypothetical protein
MKVAIATATVTVGMGVIAVPANAEWKRGKTGCFSYSYDTDPDHKETVYWRNGCKTKKYIKITINRGPDGCFGVGGKKKGNKQFLPYTAFTNATFQKAKQVSGC